MKQLIVVLCSLEALLAILAFVNISALIYCYGFKPCVLSSFELLQGWFT